MERKKMEKGRKKDGKKHMIRKDQNRAKLCGIKYLQEEAIFVFAHRNSDCQILFKDRKGW